MEAELDAERLKIKFEDPDAPGDSEFIWEKSMKQFEKLITAIKAIPCE